MVIIDFANKQVIIIIITITIILILIIIIIIIIIIEKKIGINSLSGEKKSGKNTGREKKDRGKISFGKNLVTCKKISHFFQTVFSPIRYNTSLVTNLNMLKISMLSNCLVVQSPSIQASRVQASKHPESQRSRFKHPVVQSPSVQIPSVQSFIVQLSRIQVSRRAASKNPGVQSLSAQTMRPESSFFPYPFFSKNRGRNPLIRATIRSKTETQEPCWYCQMYVNISNVSKFTNLMIYLLCIEQKKIQCVDFFSKLTIISFFTGTPSTNELDDGIPVAHFQDVKYSSR